MSQLTNYEVNGISLVGGCFFETGTCRADTLRLAAAQPFIKLTSVDVVSAHVKAASEEFSNDERITVICGSSPDVISAHADAGLTTTFYLDAHASGGADHHFDERYGECPLIYELDAIFSKPWQILPAVIVDDWFMYAGEWDERLKRTFNRSHWPTAAEVRKYFDGYVEVVVNDQAFFVPPGWPLA